tara:strand:+ start:281 stop:2812 length:2532 start_codon:yes stop_codon:yes gene_type:complete
MAALSSTQSGNWTSASTWGNVTPADGDTFTINYGHKVTVNSSTIVTQGYGDVSVYGCLHFATNTYIRFNGRITVWGQNTGTAYATPAQFTEGQSTANGSLLSSSGNNIKVEFRGTNADQHGIWVETVRFASMTLTADEKKTTTTNSAAIAYQDEYITVADDTGFAEGDWVAVYTDGAQSEDYRVLGDEGFFIHDVDASTNRIYIRQFVTPSAVIQSVSGTTVVVDDAKVFRVGYKLICGTGSNRVVASITAINNNTITFSGSFTSNQVGLTLYQTGAEKTHLTSDSVQKIATTLRTAITTANSTNQIIVGSSADISVGDEIIIDVNNDTDTNWDYNTKYTVTAKSGNTLTLDDQVRYTHKLGSLVNILTRHMTITTVDDGGAHRCFLYVEYWTDGNNAKTRWIGLDNIRFTRWGGNTSSTYYGGVMLAGYNSQYRENESTDGRYQYQSHHQGCVVDSSLQQGSYEGFSTRHPNGHTRRNNMCYDTGNQGFWGWSTQYSVKSYNNYATRSSYSCFQIDAFYNIESEFSYNYGTRSDDYGLMLSQGRDSSPIRHNILLNNEQRAIYTYYQIPGLLFDRFYIDGFRTNHHVGVAGGVLIFTDSFMDNKWFKSIDTDINGIVDASNYYAYATGQGYDSTTRSNGLTNKYVSYEHNFKTNCLLSSSGGGLMYETSENGNAFLFPAQDSSYWTYIDQVYVPANITVRVAATMKCQDGGSYTFPVMRAKKITGYLGAMGKYENGYTGYTSYQTSTNKNFSGWMQEVSWATKNVWETKTLQLEPQPKGYLLAIGIYANGNNAEEKHELENSTIDVFYEKAPPLIQRTQYIKTQAVRDGFTNTKVRIGSSKL